MSTESFSGRAPHAECDSGHKIFISDCVVFFDTIATFIQNIAGLTILAGKNVAQVSNGISNPVVAGIIYWMIRILISGGCLVGVGILSAFIEIKIAGLYKKYCWDMITIMVILVSMAIAIYFADWIERAVPSDEQVHAEHHSVQRRVLSG